MLGRWTPVILLTVSLAGCVSPFGGGCTVEVPRGDVGLRASYAVEGTPVFALTEVGGLVNWGDDYRASPDLPEGSAVHVAVGGEPREVLNWSGGVQAAHQATYWLDHAEHGPFPTGSEFIDPDSGDLVAVSGRITASFESDGDHPNGIRHVGWNRSPLLLAPMFWETRLTEDSTGSLATPERPELFHGILEGARANASLRWAVTNVTENPDGCMATVRVEFNGDFGGERDLFDHLEVRFFDQQPLPVRYREIFDEDVKEADQQHSLRDLDMRLDSLEAGDGPPLPKLRPQAPGPSVLPKRPMRDGFLAGRGGLFPTDYDAAVRAAREDDGMGAWLDNHPDARPARVSHRMGDPDSTVYDEWEITWASRDGDYRTATVTNQSATPLGVQNTKTVQGSRGDPVAYPNSSDERVSLSTLARLNQFVYDQNLEIVDCRMAVGHCWVGTHDARGTPRASGGASGGVSIAGLSVQVARGRIFLENSFDRGSIPDPVPMRS